jgi:hypothetical protein
MKALFFKLFEMALKFVDDIHLPKIRKELTLEEKEEIHRLLRPGDILLVRATGELTSYFFGLNGFSHVMIYVGEGNITDATAVGVSTRALKASLGHWSRTAIMRPKFTMEEIEKALEKYRWLKELDDSNNIEYNYTLVELEIRPDGAPESFTCAQYGRWFVNQGRADFMHLVPHFGFMTVSPEDFYEARGKFDLVNEYHKGFCK